MPGGFDLSVVLSQTSAVEKVQQLQNPNPDTRQQQFASRFAVEREKMRSNIQDAKAAEETKIHPDQHRETHGQKHQKNSSQQEGKEKPSTPPPHLGIDEGQLIDIKI